MKYTIQVKRIITDYALVSVEADNETEARRKGLKVAKLENEEQSQNGGIFCDNDAPKYKTKIINFK